MKSFLVTLLALCPGLVHALCTPSALQAPEQVSLEADAVLIVTHASAAYDPRFASKRGIDAAAGYAKKHGIPMVYLQDAEEDHAYFTDDCAPEHWVYSPNGEVGFPILSSHVYVAGGHLEQCLYNTVSEVIFSWANQPERDWTLTFLMDAIYSSGDLVRDSDEYHGDFETFMRALDHGRSEEDAWPRVTLLETVGLIAQQKRALDYLKRTLPNFENVLPPEYRVELQLNNTTVKVLQDMPAWNSPLLRIRFVDSAGSLEPI